MGVYLTTAEVDVMRWKRRLRHAQYNLAAARHSQRGKVVVFSRASHVLSRGKHPAALALAVLEEDVGVCLNHLHNAQERVRLERLNKNRHAQADWVLAVGTEA